MKPMMKAVAFGAAMAFASQALAADDGRSNVLIKFADVLAIAGRCDRMTLNMASLKLLAVAYRIDVREGSADHQVLASMVAGKRLDLQASTDDEVCGIGAMLYGRNGLNMKDLLLEK